MKATKQNLQAGSIPELHPAADVPDYPNTKWDFDYTNAKQVKLDWYRYSDNKIEVTIRARFVDLTKTRGVEEVSKVIRFDEIADAVLFFADLGLNLGAYVDTGHYQPK